MVVENHSYIYWKCGDLLEQWQTFSDATALLYRKVVQDHETISSWRKVADTVNAFYCLQKNWICRYVDEKLLTAPPLESKLVVRNVTINICKRKQV